MNAEVSKMRKRGLLVEPTYGYGDLLPRKPSLKEVWVEWIDAINFFKDSSRLMAALYLAYHLATGIVCAIFFARYLSIQSALIVTGIACGIATVYNTVWYHRYCTHRAFKFRSLWLARVFLWTNPVCFREESYVIPHRVHHSKSDQPGDPYGPHLGWLGSYLATESQQKTNRDISARDYERLAKSLEHIGFVKGSYEQFQRTASVENVWHYIVRSVFANLFWTTLAFLAAGWYGALTWSAAVFLYTFLVRDFNYRGHGGGSSESHGGTPLNQMFYGLIAGEWHENHHEYPRSARAGLAWWQPDMPYVIIRFMQLCGAVEQHHAPAIENERQPSLVKVRA